MRVAPKGASPVAMGKPAISQGSPCAHDIDASPIRIERMLRTVFVNQARLAACQSVPTSVADRRIKMKLPGDERPRFLMISEELSKARSKRDNHLAEIESVIDYALTTDAYETVRCQSCKPWTMPLAPLDFIRVAHEASPPLPGGPSTCKTCDGRRSLRQLKTDSESKAAMKRISYFKKVLPTTVLCSKVRSGGPEANGAYAKLEEQNQMLIMKFGSELQTAMEGEDAEQGARMGIIDAAKRFDPTRKEGANFGTVAYNWAFRNSRARRRSDKRAGVYAPSLDDPGSSEDGSTRGDDLRAAPVSKALVLDMRDQIQSLPMDQRKVMLAIYSGDTVASAAKALKMKRSKVKLLRDTAFATLRESLAGYVEAICD